MEPRRAQLIASTANFGIVEVISREPADLPEHGGPAGPDILSRPDGPVCAQRISESRSGIHRFMKVSNMGTVKSISPHRGG